MCNRGEDSAAVVLTASTAASYKVPKGINSETGFNLLGLKDGQICKECRAAFLRHRRMTIPRFHRLQVTKDMHRRSTASLKRCREVYDRLFTNVVRTICELCGVELCGVEGYFKTVSIDRRWEWLHIYDDEEEILNGEEGPNGEEGVTFQDLWLACSCCQYGLAGLSIY